MARDSSSWEGLHLYTDRLFLRTPTPRDADALYDLFADSDVMHGLGKDPVSAPEEARAIIEEWIGAWRTDGLGPFIIETAYQPAGGRPGRSHDFRYTRLDALDLG